MYGCFSHGGQRGRRSSNRAVCSLGDLIEFAVQAGDFPVQINKLFTIILRELIEHPASVPASNQGDDGNDGDP